MKKHTLSLILTSALFFSIFNISNISHATENKILEKSNDIQSEESATDSIEEELVLFNPVTINFILEGVETPLKTPKILNDANDFWSDYTIKFSNRLMYGGIDIQESIRNYYFSHYEIDGLRIESIDAIIEAKNENAVINVIYSEEVPKGGYLRKNFRNGIALDINYLRATSEENKNTITDLYDDKWVLEFTPELSTEIYTKLDSLVNANDKTVYFKSENSYLSDKEQNELSKRYGYIDGIKLTSSLEYDDFKNNYLLTYTLPNNVTETDNAESILYGINLEGKIEILATSSFEKNSTKFELNKNTNKYQLLFIGLKENKSKLEDDISSSENNIETNTQSSTNSKEELTSNDINEVINDNKNHTINEQSFVILVLTCFASGSIFTFILALILSARNENIKKKQLKQKNKDAE